MSFLRISSIGLGTLVAAVVVMSSPAYAITPVCLNCSPVTINYTINGLRYDVSDIVIFGETSDGAIDQLGLFSAAKGTSILAGNFGPSLPIVSTFMMGQTGEIPGEPNGAVVLFTNNTFATVNTGQSFNLLFSALLNYQQWYNDQNVQNLKNNQPIGPPGSIADESNPSNGEATLVTDLQAWSGPDLDLTHFAGGDVNAQGGPLTGAISSVGFAPGDPFTAIAFSGGTIIGAGTSAVAPVPEPATWLMMLVGFGGLGVAMRSRRSMANVSA